MCVYLIATYKQRAYMYSVFVILISFIFACTTILIGNINILLIVTGAVFIIQGCIIAAVLPHSSQLIEEHTYCNRYNVPCYEMYGCVLWLVQAARGYTESSVRSRDPEPVSLCGLEDHWTEVPV